MALSGSLSGRALNASKHGGHNISLGIREKFRKRAENTDGPKLVGIYGLSFQSDHLKTTTESRSKK